MAPAVAPLTQGIFYVATGVWPLLHLRSFEAVTGPKADRWLVKTVGALVSAVGLALLVGARERRSRALPVLGIGSALALGTIDVVYATRGRIPRIYLADALAEGALATLWALRRT